MTPDLQLKAFLSRLAAEAGDNLVSLSSMSHYVQVMSRRINPRTERSIATRDGSIAVINFHGSVVPRETDRSAEYGEVGVYDTVQRVRAARNDKKVKAIVLDVDSPGGYVMGVSEGVEELRTLRGVKPIIAHADYLMASAAYHLAMGVDEVIASPSAEVGAVGVIAMHLDATKMLDDMGLKFTAYAEPEDKADGWPMFKPSAKFDERMNEGVKDAYKVFADHIVSARNVSRDDVKKDWAGVYRAPRAKLLGMVDKVRTMPETIGAYSPEQAGMHVTRAKLQMDVLMKKGQVRKP